MEPTASAETKGPSATPGQRRIVLIALFANVFSFSVSFGGMMPWMSLYMEARSVDPVLIGIVAAANPVGVMIMAPFVARIVARLSLADAKILGSLIAVGSIALMPVFDDPGAWLVLRLINGLGGAIPWVVTETWINVVADNRSRGRIVAGYAIVMAAGFASGPLVLGFIGTEGIVPPMTFMVLNLLAIVPILMVRRYSPRFELETRQRVWRVIFAMPTVYAGVFVSATVDTAFFAFLPIWGMRIGLEPAYALTLLTVFIAGNIALQLPIGWLADRFGARRVMAICGLACIAGPVGAYLTTGTPVLLGMVLFVWGGTAWALYTLALIDIGHRCTGTALAAANGAIVLVYTLSNISGPPLAGMAMDAWNPHGFMAVAFVVAALFLLVMAVRTVQRRHRAAGDAL